jgi:hypothetical protein
MKIEHLDLHGLSLEEALEKTRKNIAWCLEHGVAVLDINHGKGYHSEHRFSVIKTEIRKYLRQEELLKEYGYIVVYGESNLPVALSFDEGHTLIVARGQESRLLGDKKQQEKNRQLYSDDARKQRKSIKALKAQKRQRRK